MPHWLQNSWKCSSHFLKADMVCSTSATCNTDILLCKSILLGNSERTEVGQLFYIPLYLSSRITCSVMSDSLGLCELAPRAPLPLKCPPKNTGVGCLFLLQGILPSQGSNLWFFCLLFLYHCATWEAPRQPQILEQLELEGPNPRWLLHSSVCDTRWTQLGPSIRAPSCFFSSVVVSDSVTSDMGAQENGRFWPSLRTQMVSHPPHSTGWSNYSLSRFKMGT